ncbi:hypothetical protein [Pedobacter jejuensis]|uniref:Uncharacterized protein n=1 Tax=Pedobacter jejuensis TaxID=1268550 RepID=A0A3N0BY64_9SPHI|nr:hypothetical protein [Pedobacter jejuensis]RNL54464.1 hypothetical protein D7004_06625 [Pedobacter jejuensis]
MYKKLSLFVFAFGLISCNQQEEPKANTDLLYFDIKGYFTKEVSRLNRTNPQIVKQVLINNTTESKTINVKDWDKELAIFSNADINKSSWRGSFAVNKTPNSEHYTSASKKIPVEDVLIEKQNQQVKKIQIIISNKNILYTSGDTLTYYPDSLYQITKYQKIKLLNPKRYQVSGRFK